MKIEELGIETSFNKEADNYSFIINDMVKFRENYISFYKKISDDYYKIVKILKGYNIEDVDNYILDDLLKNKDIAFIISKSEYSMLLKITRKSRIEKMKLL